MELEIMPLTIFSVDSFYRYVVMHQCPNCPLSLALFWSTHFPRSQCFHFMAHVHRIVTRFRLANQKPKSIKRNRQCFEKPRWGSMAQSWRRQRGRGRCPRDGQIAATTAAATVVPYSQEIFDLLDEHVH